MKYTISNDNKLRCTINIKFRFTKEEYEIFNKLAKKHWLGSLRYALYYGAKQQVNKLQEE